MMDKLRDNDVVMVTSAGNYARGHHRTSFADTDFNGHHDFEDARGLPIYFTKGRRNIQVVWDDFQQCGWNDINAFLWTRDGELIAKSIAAAKPIYRLLPSNRVHYSRNGVRPMDLLNTTK